MVSNNVRWLTGRPLAVWILATFFVIPAASTWFAVAVELTPLYGDTGSAFGKASPPRPSTGSRIKRGWPRKALLQTPSMTAMSSVPSKHPDEPQKIWSLLCLTQPLPGNRLDFCAEFTKPDSLCIRHMGTPKNHRSPPA